MQRTRNITRYTYLKTAFQGWRLYITRNHQKFVRYFSDKAYGGEEASLAAALQLREEILSALLAAPGQEEAVFARYREDALQARSPRVAHPICP